MPWSCLPAAIQQVTDHRSLQAQSVWLAIHHTDAPRLPPVSFFISSCRRRAPTERSNKCYHVWIEKKKKEEEAATDRRLFSRKKMPEAESRCASRSLLSRPLRRRRRHHHHSRRQQPPSPIYLKHVGVYVIPPTCTSIPAERLGVEQPLFRPGHAARTPAQFVSAAAARATVVSPTADFLLHLLRRPGCYSGKLDLTAARRAMRRTPDPDCLLSPVSPIDWVTSQGLSRRRGCSRVRSTRGD